MPIARLSDQELLRLLKAGNEEAFTTLYLRRQGGIYRFALHMSGSRAVAEDVTQEVFLALMNDGAGYDPEQGTLSAYLYGIARNHVLRHLERDRRHVQMPEGPENALPLVREFVAQDDPLVELARVEEMETIRQAILALPTHYREVVVLCELNEMSYAEAAAAVGCAVGTVRSRLNRARALLLEKLRANRVAKAQARCLA